MFSSGRVTEVYQGSKWLVDAPDHLLTPMVRLGGKDFYVNELTACAGARKWFIPLRFFEFEGNGMWSVGFNVEETQVRPVLVYLCSYISLKIFVLRTGFKC